jgi:iron complex transport system permease protein
MRRWGLTLVLLSAAPASLLVALAHGSVDVGLAEVARALTGDGGHPAGTLVLQLRWPRAASAFAVGGLLALSGALLQVLLRNPLADPYILGVSGGAAVAALGAMLLGLGTVETNGSAFAGALGAGLLVFGLSRAGGSPMPARLLLTGVVVAAGFGALISLMLSLAPAAKTQGMLFWLLGDFSYARTPGPALAALAFGLALSWWLARALNLLGRGELVAASLGEHPDRLRGLIYGTASLMTAVAVTLAGPIGFVGLVIPHSVRLLGGADHRWLLPHSVLAGGSFLVLADTLARSLAAPVQLPVGALTALLGVPVFLYLLWRAR